MKTEDDNICEICKKPVVDGEARHGGTGNHYDCQYPNGRKSDRELLEDADAALGLLEETMVRKAIGRMTPLPRKLIRVSTPSTEKVGIEWDERRSYDDDL